MASNPAVAHDEGLTPLAVAEFKVCFPSNDTTFWDTYHMKYQIDGVFPFTNLPIELQDKIIGYAMTAIGQQIIFPCLTNAAYMLNVAGGLLLAK